jgi:type IV pilus assembly protein PilE
MRGFSLIEVLVTMAIAGVLAALAIPGYTQVVNRALRQDARLSLLRLQHRMEIIFANGMSYAPEGATAGPAHPSRSGQGHYLLDLHIAQDGMAYIALARADPAGRQASDSRCAAFSIDQTGRRRTADASGNWRDDDPHRCWS